MIRVLQPQYYTNYDTAWAYGENNKTKLHDMYFGAASFYYDFVDFAIDAPHGITRRAECAYCYNTSNLSIKSVYVPLKVRYIYPTNEELLQNVAVQLYEVDEYGAVVRALSDERTIVCSNSSTYNQFFELIFPFTFDPAETIEYLSVRIRAETPDDCRGKKITIYAPAVKIDADGLGFTAGRSHLPRDMKNEVLGLKAAIDSYASRFCTNRAAVRFYDYTGELVYAYTPEELLQSTILPANPVHKGLISQGWNWSLEDAKAYVRKYGRLDIGQMYIADDGATRLYVHIPKEFLEFELKFKLISTNTDGTPTARINWGDRNDPSEVSGSDIHAQHTYEAEDDYVISLYPENSRLDFSPYAPTSWVSTNLLGDSSPLQPHMLQKVEVGENATIGEYAFLGCSRLKAVALPNGLARIDFNAFAECQSLIGVVVPMSATSLSFQAFAGNTDLSWVSLPKAVREFGADEDLGECFSGCTSLLSICVPEDSALRNRTFFNCAALEAVVLPDNISDIDDYMFAHCSALASITIPENVTKIGKYVFWNCSSLRSICLANHVAELGAHVFDGCTTLRLIHFSDQITSIPACAFQGCTQLTSLYIPDNVVSIGDSAFASCTGLSEISLPIGLASIGSRIFDNCTELTRIIFRGEVPPEDISESAWYGIEHTYWIQVPKGCVNVYQNDEGMPEKNAKEGDPVYTDGDGSLTAVVVDDQLLLTGVGASVTANEEISLSSPNSALDNEDHLVFL